MSVVLAGSIKWNRPSETFQLVFQNPVTYKNDHTMQMQLRMLAITLGE